MSVYKVVFPLNLDHFLEVVFHFFSVVEVADDCLDQIESIHVVNVKNFHEGTSSIHAVTFHKYEPCFQVEKEFVNCHSFKQKLSKSNDFPVAVEVRTHEPDVESPNSLKADVC